MNNNVEILVVEDSRVQARYLRQLLEKHNYAVSVAYDGREALSAIRQHRPTLVISDVVMPRMDGYELCRRIKADASLRELPVILLTQLSEPEDVIKGLECGADNFMTKPYNERLLLSRIQYTLANLELRRSAMAELGLGIVIGGKHHFITASRMQILDLLISTYDSAIQKSLELRQANSELRQAEQALRRANEELESRVAERTAALRESNAQLRQEIAERMRAEEALRESGEHFRDLYDNAPNAYFSVGADGRIRRCNRRAGELLGYAVEELAGRPVLDLYADTPHGKEKAAKVLDRFRAGETVRDVELQMQKADGTPVWIGLTVNAVRDAQGRVVGSRSMVVDITERKQAEEALEASEQKYRTLVEQSLQGVIVVQDFRIAFANTAFAEISGYTVEELLSLSPPQVMAMTHPEDQALVWGRFRDRLAGKPVPERYEYRGVRKDGTLRWLEMFASRVEYGGKPAIQGVVIDITERKRAEEALQRSLEETAHSQRLLLALSQAAQAVQRARTSEEVHRTIGDEVSRLGYHAAIFTLTEDRTHLTPSYLSYEPAVLRAAEKLAGLSAQGYRFPLVPGGLYQRIIAGGKAVFSEPTLEFVTEALPAPLRPLAGRLAALLGLEQSIIAPLVVGGESHGLLAVGGTGLSEADVPAVSTFANQAAIALENARLFLSLTEQRAQLRALTARLAEKEEEERQRLARELHDRVGQNLTALSINLNIMHSLLPDEAVAQVGARLEDSLRLVEETAERIRDVMGELRPSVLDDYGLLAALHWYAERLSQRTDVTMVVQGEEPVPRLPPAVETALFRIAQEALTNVAKHAQATQATVTLEPVDGGARLTIADDGVGFDPTALQPSGERAGWGMLTMRERAEAVGGHLRVESAPGKGTRIIVEVPK